MTQFVQQAPAGVFLIMLVFAGGLAGVGLFAAGRSLWQRRALQSTSLVPTASAARGYVRVEGKCRTVRRGPLTAPLTRSPCCRYRIRVEESVRTSSKSRENGYARALQRAAIDL